MTVTSIVLFSLAAYFSSPAKLTVITALPSPTALILPFSTRTTLELEEAYVASETQLNSHDESEGAYVKFKSDGETIVIHSRPLDEERSEKGTIDFHSQTLGFATFDVVGDVSSEEGVKSIDLNSLNELISKSMLVSLYEHY